MRLYSRVGDVWELDEQLDVWEHDLKKYNHANGTDWLANEDYTYLHILNLDNALLGPRKKL
jgi:hypothetical protein